MFANIGKTVLLLIASFCAMNMAWSWFGPARFSGRERGWLALLTWLVILIVGDVAYFAPKYGGYLGYAFDGIAAGSAAGAIAAELGSLRSSLSIYYGDNDGKYPESLEELWKDKKYLPSPLRRADISIRLPGLETRFGRAHWYRDAGKIKNFSSPADSDDTGGWGYVNDPKSPHFGKVFVNCTHENFKTGRPWNLEGVANEVKPDIAPAFPSAPLAMAPPVDAAPSVAGLGGSLFAKDIHGALIGGGELVFRAESGGVFRATIDADGHYAIDLPTGRYHVKASAPGYATYTTGSGFTVVTPGRRNTANFFLRPL